MTSLIEVLNKYLSSIGTNTAPSNRAKTLLETPGNNDTFKETQRTHSHILAATNDVSS